MKAIWNGQVLAESDATVQVEGNHYFPPSAVHASHLQPSDTSTHCFWKGDAAYYNVDVEGEHLKDAAWYYPGPYMEAEYFRGFVAFGKSVQVTE